MALKKLVFPGHVNFIEKETQVVLVPMLSPTGALALENQPHSMRRAANIADESLYILI
jgi:hypothetical protein